jgi:hypothetical protein
VRLDGANLPEAFEPENDASFYGDGAARESGAAAARDDRDAVLVAPRYRVGDLLGGFRQDHRLGAAANPSGLRRIDQVVRRHVWKHTLGAEERGQSGAGCATGHGATNDSGMREAIASTVSSSSPSA